MARSQKRAPQVGEVRPYVEGVAKNLIDQLYGPDGPPWGTKLTRIEDVILAVREVLGERMVADALARQARAHDRSTAAYRVCPGCQAPLSREDANERIPDTRVGEAEWTEPEGRRRRRRSFFPSVQKPEH